MHTRRPALPRAMDATRYRAAAQSSLPSADVECARAFPCCPQCEACANASHWFRNHDAKCHACNTGAHAGAFIGLLFGGILVVAIVAALLWTERLPKVKAARKLVKMAKWNAAVWTSAGMRNKLKYAAHVRAFLGSRRGGVQ